MTFVAPSTWMLSGCWTVLHIGVLARKVAQDDPSHESGEPVIDGSRLASLDTVGAMLVDRWLAQMARGGSEHAHVERRGWLPAHARLIARASRQGDVHLPKPPADPSRLARLGMTTIAVSGESGALLSLVGECAVASPVTLRHPGRMRWRPLLHGGRAISLHPPYRACRQADASGGADTRIRRSRAGRQGEPRNRGSSGQQGRRERTSRRRDGLCREDRARRLRGSPPKALARPITRRSRVARPAGTDAGERSALPCSSGPLPSRC
jgi:hypothetical protein